MEDLRQAQACFDTEAAHLRIRALRRAAEHDAELRAMIADDLRWMPGLLMAAAAVFTFAAALLP